MLTGDNERTAKAVASKLGISRVIAQVLPQRKEQIISMLKEQEEKRIVVAMVGDGINDAPALARADLGIAIGSGTDVAKETGGIILIKDDIRDVVTALDLGRKTVSKIKQNLFWAFAYNAGLIPIAGGVTGAFSWCWNIWMASHACWFSNGNEFRNSSRKFNITWKVQAKFCKEETKYRRNNPSKRGFQTSRVFATDNY